MLWRLQRLRRCEVGTLEFFGTAVAAKTVETVKTAWIERLRILQGMRNLQKWRILR